MKWYKTNLHLTEPIKSPAQIRDQYLSKINADIRDGISEESPIKDVRWILEADDQMSLFIGVDNESEYMENIMSIRLWAEEQCDANLYNTFADQLVRSPIGSYLKHDYDPTADEYKVARVHFDNEKNQFIFHEAAMEEMRSLTRNNRDLSNSYQVFEPKPILLSDEAKKYVPDFMKDASVCWAISEDKNGKTLVCTHPDPIGHIPVYIPTEELTALPESDFMPVTLQESALAYIPGILKQASEQGVLWTRDRDGYGNILVNTKPDGTGLSTAVHESDINYVLHQSRDNSLGDALDSLMTETENMEL